MKACLVVVDSPIKEFHGSVTAACGKEIVEPVIAFCVDEVITGQSWRQSKWTGICTHCATKLSDMSGLLYGVIERKQAKKLRDQEDSAA